MPDFARKGWIKVLSLANKQQINTSFQALFASLADISIHRVVESLLNLDLTHTSLYNTVFTA